VIVEFALLIMEILHRFVRDQIQGQDQRYHHTNLYINGNLDDL
jgi:hypothetical protein